MGKKTKNRKGAPPAGLRKLERRIAAVEEQLGTVARQAREGYAGAADGLPTASPSASEPPPPGGVEFNGSVDLPAGQHVERQSGALASMLLDGPWDDVADRLAALAHPVRVELLRHILRGLWSTAALAELEIVGTTGQLYHHLNQLVAAGWLRRSGRGRYEVPTERVVPLLVVLAAVRS